MAGTTHYRFYTSNQTEKFDVQIKDTTYAGTDFLTIYPDGNGFNLNWEGDTSTTYTPILSATFTANLQNDTNARALLNDIVAGAGNQFVVCIYKWNTDTEWWDRMWSGVVMQDSISLPDASWNPPVDYLTLVATDGFGLLKDVPFNDYVIESLSRSSVNNLIWNALSEIPHDNSYRGYADYEGCLQTKFISEASVWYEDSMDSSVVTDANHGDPLMNTLINHSAFLEVDDYGIVSPKSWYDVLQYILITFNLQISQWNGTFLIIQQNTYTQSQTRAWHYDWQNDDYITTELIDLKATMPDRLTGGVFTHILPVKKVTTEYEYRSGVFGNNLFPAEIYEDTTYSCGPFDIGAVIRIVGRLVATLEMVGSGTEANITLEHNITVRNGSLYLHKHATSGLYYWGVTANSLSFTRTVYLEDVEAGDLFTMTNEFDIILPATIGVDDNITFSYSMASCTNSIGDDPTTTDGPSQLTGSIIVSTGEAGLEGSYKFQSTVNNTALADLELENSILGDGPYNFSAGEIHVINASDNAVPANAWTIYSEIGGTAIAVNSLRCKEMIALRRVTVQMYEGTFYGVPNIHKGFTWLSKSWVWLSMSFDASKGQFTGTAMAVVLDRTSITVATPLISTSENQQTSSGGSTVIPSDNGFSVEDGIFDLSLLNGVLSVAPYENKQTDLTHVYYGDSISNRPNYVDASYLNFDAYIRALEFSAFTEDSKTHYYYSKILHDGLTIYDVNEESDNYIAWVFLDAINHILNISAQTTSNNLPIIIGDEANHGDYHGEYIKIDDFNQRFTINFTKVLLDKGTASKFLALDASKEITYLDADNFSHFKAGTNGTLADIYNYLAETGVNYKGIDFINGSGIVITGSSLGNGCLGINIASVWKRTTTTIEYVNANDTLKLGDSTNYLEVESDGTLVLHGTATAWDDLRVEPVVRAIGDARAPSFEMWRQNDEATSRGVWLYSLTDETTNLKEVHFTMQMPHDWAQTAIYFHVHWIGNLDDTTAAPYFGLEYSWAEIGTVFPVTTEIYTDGSNYTAVGTDANITAYKHYISKFAAITPSSSQDGISSIMIARLFRYSNSVNDTYNVANNKCGLLYIDAHYERNSLGSHTEYTK